MTPSPKPIIGLVGGIGSGKSLVAERLAARGGHWIAADKFGHDALRQPDILRRITERWNNRVLDEAGQVDRKKMAAIVFNSPVERVNLEHLVFPYIHQRTREAIAAAQADPYVGFIVLDAPVMLEAGWNKECEWIVYVSSPRSLRLARLSAHRGWSEADVVRREQAQMPLTLKATLADAAIDNAGTPDNLDPQIHRLLRQWQLI